MTPPATSINDVVASLFATLRTTRPAALSGGAGDRPGPAPPTRGLATVLESAGLKPILITLHCLFPHAFLPALDILDRRLILRIGTDSDSDRAAAADAPDPVSESLGRPRGSGGVYYVRSSQQARRRGRAKSTRNAQDAGPDGSERAGEAHGDDDGTYYEVRMRAWSCTCAAFAFAALGGEAATQERPAGEGLWPDVSTDDVPVFGGLRRTGETVPTCKHVLACFLLETWPMVADCCTDLAGDRKDEIGWAAGWR